MGAAASGARLRDRQRGSGRPGSARRWGRRGGGHRRLGGGAGRGEKGAGGAGEGGTGGLEKKKFWLYTILETLTLTGVGQSIK
jgi:hypothetical protein